MKSGPGELKLKNKMLGNKRDWEETNLSGSAATLTLEDDEEESKSRVIQKKPRLDPFASGRKKGKGLGAPVMVPPHKLAGNPSAFGTNLGKKMAIPTKDESTPGPSSFKMSSACE